MTTRQQNIDRVARTEQRVTRTFQWKKLGRKKLIGYCPDTATEVQVERIGKGYVLTVAIEGRVIDMGKQFPTFSKRLMQASTSADGQTLPSVWVHFQHTFEEFVENLRIGKRAALAAAAAPEVES